VRADGAVLLRRRPEKGLLGGMMEVPSTAWRETAWSAAEAKEAAPVRARWRALPDPVRHTFTHFALELTVLAGAVGAEAAADGVWVPPDKLGDYALPSLMKKVIAYASR
jgi:A/G-specific adenine glycosylase